MNYTTCPSDRKAKHNIYRIYGQCGILPLVYTWFRVFTAPLFQIERYVPKTATILDVGCGYGIFANILCLTSDSRIVSGFDVSEKRIRIARSTVGSCTQLSFHTMDVIDCKLSGYDVITIIDLLHHIPYEKQETLLRKAYHALDVPALVLVKDLEKKPFWKYIFHFAQDSLLYRSPLFFRSTCNMKSLLSNIGYTVTRIPLKSWLPYPHVLYLCQK